MQSYFVKELMQKLKKFGKPILLLITGILSARFFIYKDRVHSLQVRRVHPDTREVIRTVSAIGEVVPEEDAKLSFTLPGTISRIYVQKGDTVNKGQYIASLTNPETAHEIQVAKDARDIAIRERDLFIERYKEASSKHELGGDEEYKILLREKNEYVSKAEANYEAVIARTSKNYIRAPFDGIILDVFKETGETCNIGEPVARIGAGKKFFEASVDQEDFGQLKPGQSVEISLDAFPNETFEGAVTKLPQYAPGGTNPDFTVDIPLTENEKILTGMQGDMKITVAKSDGQVQALLYDEIIFDAEDKPFVWIERNGLIEKLPIQIGLEGDLYTEVKTDLSKYTVIAPLNSNIELEEGFKAKFQDK